MPIKVIRYECAICGQRYSEESDAKECEDRGTGEEYPIGCIHASHVKGDIYENITFAVAINEIKGHANWGSDWACRDNGAGDSLGEQKCGCGTLKLYHDKIDPEHPTFKRMVKWLRKQKIDITVWDGKKPVKLKEWLKNLPDKGKKT